MSQTLFLSDFHLGVPDKATSDTRERKICSLLQSYRDKVSDIYFVGDVFDFWFEYNTVVPKGYYRLFGLLKDLSESGIQLHFFKGNHDMWMRDFFVEEFNAKIYSQPLELLLNNKKIIVGHGDGLGPGDYKYKFLKRFFASPICQFLYRWIHPDIGMRIASFFSYRSRYAQPTDPEVYFGNDKEWLYIYCKEICNTKSVDYFVFGHRHLPIYTQIENYPSYYINLGDWIDYCTYAVFDGNELSLYQYGTENKNHYFNPNTRAN